MLENLTISKATTNHSRTVLRNLKSIKKLKLTFGQPKNGWLPTCFESERLNLKFNVSNTPENPVASLCKNLILALQGVESECEWNMEPEVYIFRLRPTGKQFFLEILKKQATKGIKTVFSSLGDFNSIILPLYRGLKNLNSSDFNQNDWDKIDEVSLQKLNELVAERTIKTA